MNQMNTGPIAEAISRNARVQQRYDELQRVGKHGHYETMFQVVREEVERVKPTGCKPGDIVRKDDLVTGLSRFWEIEGVHLGAVGQESLVCLRPLSETPGGVGQMAYTNTHVPAAFVQGSIYTSTR